MGRLTGKVAVILGASDARSMGAATARRFVEEGAQVVLAARRKEAVEEIAAELGGIGVACDIADEASLAALAQTALEHYGHLDIACAASRTFISSALPCSSSIWRRR